MRGASQSSQQNGKVIFPCFPFNACNLDSRCITWNSPSWSAAGMATLSRIRRGCLFCSFFFVYFFFLYRCIFLPTRSKTVPRCERAIHTFRGGNRSSDPLSKDYKASGAVPRPAYEVCYSETNPSSYFANNGVNAPRYKIFQMVRCSQQIKILKLA